MPIEAANSPTDEMNEEERWRGQWKERANISDQGT
jgi:hypothetical protein